MNINSLKKEQLKLASKVVLKDSFKKVELIGGCDQAFVDNKKIISAVVVCDKEFNVLEKEYAVVEPKIPYISGYLFYREGPAVIEAFNKLKEHPNILIVGAHGIIHPRRLGMASQLGLVLNQATIGVAAKLLCGKVENGKVIINNEICGFEFRSREHSHPIYVSPGHNVSLETSLRIIKDCMRFPHKLPEPLHLAHRYANSLKKELD